MPRPPMHPTIAARFTEPGMLARSEVMPGWQDLILDLDATIAGYDPAYIVVQVKEKFGGLRYYIFHEHNDMCGWVESEGHSSCRIYKAINSAEAASFSLCEACGKAGSLRRHGWMRTLCDEHDEESH